MTINVKNNFVFIHWTSGEWPQQWHWLKFVFQIRLTSGLICVRRLHFQWQLYPKDIVWDHAALPNGYAERWTALPWFSIKRQ